MQRWLSAPALDFAALRRELGVTAAFPDDVLAEARTAVDRCAAQRADRRDLPLVTIDPPGSKDLDQALCLTAVGDGYRVHYAIADVGAAVIPGTALDAEARRRGQTLYFPDGSVPLHPREFSEGSGSLLPGADRPAVLWTVDVGGDGAIGTVGVQRATVRSRERLHYRGVSDDAAAGRLHPSIAALPGFGAVMEAAGLARGAVNLDLPEQEVVPYAGPGRAWTLRLAPRTDADGWNAQVSLLVGRCAGELMYRHGTGLLRTLPKASDEAVADLRAAADSLGVRWPDGLQPGEFLATLDPGAPSTLALMNQGAKLMRGAGYLALDGGPVPPRADAAHNGVGGLYAHVTAPLRRLSDRFATEVCLAVANGGPVPEWAAEALPSLPKIMSSSDGLAGTVNRRSIDLTEATVLADQVGARFGAVVMRGGTDSRPAQILVESPAIVGDCDGAPAAGNPCAATVVEADPATGRVRFAAG